MRYCTEAREYSERVVNPYGVVFWTGRWYMVGYCHLREGIRAFRVDRVREVTIQPTAYDPPGDFDCLDYIVHSFGRFVHTWEVEVILQTTLEEAQAKIPQMHGSVEVLPEGVKYCSRVDNMAETARFLVELRLPFVVIKPPELRVALRELAVEISQYAEEVQQAS